MVFVALGLLEGVPFLSALGTDRYRGLDFLTLFPLPTTFSCIDSGAGFDPRPPKS